MSGAPEVPRLRSTVRRAIGTHRGAWGTIAAAAAVALIPGAALQGLIQNEAVSKTDNPALFATLALAGGAAGMLGYFFLNGVIAQVVVARRRGTMHPGLGAIARGLPWARLIALDLLVTAGTAIGLLLLVVPGVVFVTRFGLAPVLVETDDLAVGAALRRSSEITRERQLLVLSCLVAPLALVAAASYPIHLAVDALLPWPGSVEWGVAALVSGIAVKPFASVVTVELATELDEATPRSDTAR